MDQTEMIVRAVVERLMAAEKGMTSMSAPAPATNDIPAEMSARHVHLSTADLKELFGKDTLEVVRKISQPGQYLSDCRVRLIGPKGSIDNVAVLGPTRKQTQVEISATDARGLGISAPVRLSGQLQDAAEVYIQAGAKLICRKAAIVAERHIHMTPADAQRFSVKDGDRVSVRVLGKRPLILENTPVRVTDESALALHMDTDEANAAGAGKDCRCVIVNGTACAPAPCAPCAPAQTAAAPAAAAGPAVIDNHLITEKDILNLKKQGVQRVLRKKGQLITALARDTAKAAGIRLEEEL